MTRVPLTAKQQLELAREQGHELWIEHGQRVCCTCGYRSTMRLSRTALNGTMAWHLAKALTDAGDALNGGPGASAR